MADEELTNVKLDDDELAGVSGGSGTSSNCNVKEEDFPRLAVCYSKASSWVGTSYQPICPHCSIWTSPPEGASLIITNIIECTCHGYGKRLRG